MPKKIRRKGKRIHRTGKKGQASMQKSANKLAMDLERCPPEKKDYIYKKYLENKTPEQIKFFKKIAWEKARQTQHKKIKMIENNLEKMVIQIKAIAASSKTLQKTVQEPKLTLNEIRNEIKLRDRVVELIEEMIEQNRKSKKYTEKKFAERFDENIKELKGFKAVIISKTGILEAKAVDMRG